MGLKIVLLTVVMCAGIIETSANMTGLNCDSSKHLPEIIRIKRAKYFSNPPQRFYRRPPMTYPVKGPFSYTPPPSYMIDDEPQYPANLRPAKVSKRPTNEGLGDEDISNIVKYLTKKDLDRIVNFAGDKERYIDKYADEPSEKYPVEYSKPSKRPDYSQIFKESFQELDDIQKLNIPFGSYDQDDTVHAKRGIEQSHKVAYDNGLYPNLNQYAPQFKTENSYPSTTYAKAIPQFTKEIDNTQKFIHNGPYVNQNQGDNPLKMEYNNPSPKYETTPTYTKEMNSQKFIYNGPYVNQNQGENPLNIEFNNPSANYAGNVQYPTQAYNPNYNYNNAYVNQNQEGKYPNFENNPSPNINYVSDATQPKILYANPANPQESSPSYTYNTPAFPNVPLETEETVNKYQVSYLTADVKEMLMKDGNIFTDGTVMKEEQLPRPVNLREPDYEVSFTNKVPAVVKAESSSYKVESFGDLPLANYYNTKLHMVSSYNVPHYTVTSSAKPPPPQSAPPTSPISSPVSFSSSGDSPLLERAPPDADGKDQSDAHLKAIRIWTHRSKGTAYTLHDDGTLSLEVPRRPKPHHH